MHIVLQGKAPLLMAGESGRHEILDLFRQHTARPDCTNPVNFVVWDKESHQVLQLRLPLAKQAFFFNILKKTQLPQNSKNFKTQPDFSQKLNIFFQNSDSRQQVLQSHISIFFIIISIYFSFIKKNGYSTVHFLKIGSVCRYFTNQMGYSFGKIV